MRLPMTPTAMAAAILMIGGGWTAPAQAGIDLTTPAGLAPGDQFRFVFVTDGTTTATSTDISTYDNFAQTQADGATYDGVTVSWLAIGSTTAVNAIDHIGQTETPVYLVDGTMVTPNTTTTGLWSGTLDSPIDEDISGQTLLTTTVWTGTNYDGTQSNIAPPLGSAIPDYGITYLTNNEWIAAGHGIAPQITLSLYSISQILTVPQLTTVPEPSSKLLLGVGGALVSAHGWARRRRDQRRQGPVVGPADLLQ